MDPYEDLHGDVLAELAACKSDLEDFRRDFVSKLDVVADSLDALLADLRRRVAGQ